jgi:multisubunit Na+/H+ antiporter MnhG subunit
MSYLGHFLIIVGIIFILLTLIGVERHLDFSKRLLISSLTDSTALILIITGLILVGPFELYILKLILILVLNLILGPILINIVINHYGGRR